MAKSCLVYHSTTKGTPSKVVRCYPKKAEAVTERNRLNRTAGMGGWYEVHRDTVVRMWRDRGDPGDWSLAGRHG